MKQISHFFLLVLIAEVGGLKNVSSPKFLFLLTLSQTYALNLSILIESIYWLIFEDIVGSNEAAKRILERHEPADGDSGSEGSDG